MQLLGKLTFLWATSLVTAQILYANAGSQVPGTLLNYEQLSKIIQSPLLRKNLAPSSSETVSSYLPLNYGESETKSLNDESNSKSIGSQSPPPSLVLEAPKPEAVDSFANSKSIPEPSQIFQTYQPNPYAHINPAIPQRTVFPQAIKFLNTQKDNDKEIEIDQYLPINPLSKQLDIPVSSEELNYPPVPSTELQTPHYGAYNQQFNTNFEQYVVPNVYGKNIDSAYPTLSQNLEVPKSESIKPKLVPTNQFPKKYNSNVHENKPKKGGKNIPVIEIFNDELIDVSDIKKVVRPQKLKYSPSKQQSDESVNSHEKQRLKFENVQKKIKSNKDNEARKQQQFIDTTLARAKGEQVASETGFNSFQHDGGFASSGSADTGLGLSDISHGASGERTDFQMHGQHGPHSYKFGYDTGKGKNRQFRYEERDNDGYVKGHYGFYDKHGKLQVVNYDAHPHHGFHAEGSFGKV